MDYFEIVEVLEEIEEMSNKLIKKWFRDAARVQCNKFLYVRGKKAPNYSVPAIRYDVEIEPTYVYVGKGSDFKDYSMWELDHVDTCRCEVCRFWS